MVERTIQSLKNLILANLQDQTSSKARLDSPNTPKLRKHLLRPISEALYNQIIEPKKCFFSGLKRPLGVYNTEHRRRDYRPPGHVQKEDDGAQSQTRDDFLPNQKTDQYVKYKQIQQSLQILLKKTTKRNP